MHCAIASQSRQARHLEEKRKQRLSGLKLCALNTRRSSAMSCMKLVIFVALLDQDETRNTTQNANKLQGTRLEV